MLRIGIDVDGVMYHWNKTARYMLRDVLPDSPYTMDGPLGQESDVWNYVKDNVSPEHWHWLWTEGVKEGLFHHGHLYKGTIVAMKQLAKLGELHIFTHRPLNACVDTLRWLGYQEFRISGMNILHNERPKSSVKPDCDVYLDDKPENIADLAMNTNANFVALMRRPMNDYYQFDHNVAGATKMIRVGSWSQFVRAVEVIA